MSDQAFKLVEGIECFDSSPHLSLTDECFCRNRAATTTVGMRNGDVRQRTARGASHGRGRSGEGYIAEGASYFRANMGHVYVVPNSGIGSGVNRVSLLQMCCSSDHPESSVNQKAIPQFRRGGNGKLSTRFITRLPQQWLSRTFEPSR